MSTQDQSASLNTVMREAIQQFKLDKHHEKIYDNPNELIEAGFPADFLLPLICIFQSGEGYQYFRQGKPVEQLIGISHLTLVWEIAECLGVPKDIGVGLTGRGFKMNAKIRAIREIMAEEHKTS